MKNWILIIVSLNFVVSMQAGGTDSIQYPELNKTYIKSYWHDTKSFVVSPAKWRTKQLIEFQLHVFNRNTDRDNSAL